MIVTVAAGPYAHLAAIQSGNGAGGLEVRYEALEPGKIFPRMQKEAAWDAAEMSLATAYIMADRGERRFVALPVFPSRAFRHSALYVPAGSAIRAASGLGGKRIGVLRYAMTTAVWVRALLAGQYGVQASSLEWVVGEDSPHPASVSPTIAGSAAALERMAAAGDIDCYISGRTPAAFHDGKLRRLFPDFGAEEKAYYARTGVFPIMHTIVAKRERVEGRDGIAPALLQRFESAKRVAEEGLRNFDVSTYPLPWLSSYVEDATRQVSGDLWPYGIEPNRKTLTAFGDAIAAEGLTSRALAPEEVFYGG